MHPGRSTEYRLFLDRYLQQNARPVDKYGHQPRLYRLTQQVGKNLVYDDEVVFAASFLHDLGVFIGHRPEEPELLSSWNHVQYAVDQAPHVLRQSGFPEEKVAAVLQAIAEHQPGDEPSTVEATVLRDADILEQLGAVGIFRAVAKTGRDTRFPTFTPVKAALQRALDELPGRIRLPSTRALAAPRIALLSEFLRGIEQEAGELLC